MVLREPPGQPELPVYESMQSINNPRATWISESTAEVGGVAVGTMLMIIVVDDVDVVFVFAFDAFDGAVCHPPPPLRALQHLERSRSSENVAGL
jgi:hypothetical protein